MTPKATSKRTRKAAKKQLIEACMYATYMHVEALKSFRDSLNYLSSNAVVRINTDELDDVIVGLVITASKLEYVLLDQIPLPPYCDTPNGRQDQ